MALFTAGVSAFVLIMDSILDGAKWDDDPEPEAIRFVDPSSKEQLIGLKGKWKFRKGDNPEWARPSFDDRSWRDMSLPGRWEGKGARGYDGYAWFRKSFRIGTLDANKSVYVVVGKIDDVDEVFVNGERIGSSGSFPPEYITAWDQERAYRIPPSYLREGERNILAVRVYDDELGGGIWSGPLGVYATELPQPIVALEGTWKFAKGDNPAWKEEIVDTSEFEEISVPGLWEDRNKGNYDGFAWYRRSFELEELPETMEATLLLGRIDDTDQVYINGQRVGNTGELDGEDRARNNQFYRYDRVYHFDASILKSQNTIAVRVHDSGGGGGIYQGPLGIMARSDYLELKERLESGENRALADAIDWLLGR